MYVLVHSLWQLLTLSTYRQSVVLHQSSSTAHATATIVISVAESTIPTSRPSGSSAVSIGSGTERECVPLRESVVRYTCNSVLQLTILPVYHTNSMR